MTTVLEAVALLFALGFVLLAVLFARRVLIARSGAVELSVRLYRARFGRGWALGLARFSGDQLRWYRLFSFSPWPRRVLTRRELVVVGRRDPSEQETLALMTGSVVLECADRTGPVDLAMSGSALTGFLSWLESAAPGSFPSR
ncbi:DUF2550 domain-containing protein [Cryptosporangium aurantiacum]|uniref:DUF2550 domain-containing protein n=1 Tax=Cryptosporangium aurantiacum TaxID=134849 RepID=A0A1M7H9K8_9ACTN|nr:DUF2550 domain-containing protein [Cryptosporangium aurantiacum]SHM25194.1 Protein of unknown function [Cryptosporangium aurantiacum]